MLTPLFSSVLWSCDSVHDRAAELANNCLEIALNNFAFLGFLYLIRIDVTEVQIFIIIMHLLAVIGGPPFWQSLVILFMFLF